MATTAEELHTMIDRLPPRDQERILAYARELAQRQPYPHTPLPPGTPPEVLLRFTVSPEVADALEQAMMESERVDIDEHF